MALMTVSNMHASHVAYLEIKNRDLFLSRKLKIHIIIDRHKPVRSHSVQLCRIVYIWPVCPDEWFQCVS